MVTPAVKLPYTIAELEKINKEFPYSKTQLQAMEKQYDELDKTLRELFKIYSPLTNPPPNEAARKNLDHYNLVENTKLHIGAILYGRPFTILSSPLPASNEEIVQRSNCPKTDNRWLDIKRYQHLLDMHLWSNKATNS